MLFSVYSYLNHLGLKCLLHHRQAAPFTPVPGRLLYVPASSLPYHISGYTTRTHAILQALGSEGVDVRILTRPGYPWDRKDSLHTPTGPATTYQGIHYHHTPRPSRMKLLVSYVWQAAQEIATFARAHSASCIMAASNHKNALPALVAARWLGLPFFYEIRGLWELTRASRVAGFEGSPMYRSGLAWEGFVAQQADTVFTISHQLSLYAQTHWAVPEAKIRLLPNCISPASFPPPPHTPITPWRIGYAGSLICYEGLHVLLQAIALLRQQGHPATLSIAGDGEAKQSLEALAAELGLQEHVQFLGKLPPEAARNSLAPCSLVCIPRVPAEVCYIVPPIKLVEALALEKPVVVPDLPVFQDELGNSGAGYFFTAGNATALAHTLSQAMQQPEQLVAAGKKGREHALATRNWHTWVPGIQAACGHNGKETT